MKIKTIEAFAIKIPRDLTTARGTAGSPAPLVESGNEYRWATNYQTIYSTKIETALIKVTTDNGLIGWGEAQAPVAPEVVCTIIRTILAPLLLGENPLAHEKLWSLMYAAMRVRGHTGSFLLDAIAGIDTALWDIKGKALNVRVCDLLGGPFKDELPAYISGLSGANDEARIQQARGFLERGFKAFKLFMDGEPDATLQLIDRVRMELGEQAQIFVDALWRFDPARAVRFGKQLESFNLTLGAAALPKG
jgi:D-galactarolactone cycloisomerase